MPETRICAREDCQKPFTPKSYNAKYCTPECQKIATNRRLMEKYYEKKDRRQGRRRICKTRGCQTILSRYNDTEVCEKCRAEEAAEKRNNLFNILDYIEYREE